MIYTLPCSLFMYILVIHTYICITHCYSSPILTVIIPLIFCAFRCGFQAKCESGDQFCRYEARNYVAILRNSRLRGLDRVLWTRLAHATSSTADNHKGLSPLPGKQSTTVLTSSRHDGLLCSWRIQSAVLESGGISGGYHNPSCTRTVLCSGVTSLPLREQGEGTVERVRLDKARQTIGLLS